tara:strand:- start:1396 stop:1608 length:213 start_codon:yes stop_codon:yes gene_type:complete
MSVKSRLERLEDASGKAVNCNNVAMISYDPIKQSKADAVAEWEAKNGPLSDCLAVFFTTFETKPVPIQHP